MSREPGAQRFVQLPPALPAAHGRAVVDHEVVALEQALAPHLRQWLEREGVRGVPRRPVPLRASSRKAPSGARGYCRTALRSLYASSVRRTVGEESGAVIELPHNSWSSLKAHISGRLGELFALA